MAKINHNNYLDTIDHVLTNAQQKGLLFLNTSGFKFAGKQIEIDGNKLMNFGTCGYLGLESDLRLISGAIHYAKRYGTQFSVSRTYLNANYLLKLEHLISKIYGLPVIVQSSTSTCHISAIPSLVRENDMVILDQAVHFSVNTACQLLRQKGIPIDMIRHNRVDMLEERIKTLRNRYAKIWYMIDGVYSMYGEVAPVKDLLDLQRKYAQLHLYIDDAHGMSWYGENGSGYFFDNAGLNDQTILITTLAKGFGTTGGVIVLPDKDTFHKIRTFGGPLTYSHPIAPSGVGAAIASARIHLSQDIYRLQKKLSENIQYCNDLLSDTDLPVFSHPTTPIYFIGTGKLKVGHNIVDRLIKEGFYINLALFPAVPVRNTGLRFTLTCHQDRPMIKNLVDALAFHFPFALQEEDASLEEIYMAFQKTTTQDVQSFGVKENNNLTLQYENSIKKINCAHWNDLFSPFGPFDWQYLETLEKVFSKNEKPEQNWDFHYFIVRDKNNHVVVATFFISSIFKDDFLTLEHISKNIEVKRSNDPYFLSSFSLLMGSLLTEGQHLFCDRTHRQWKDALTILLKRLDHLQQKLDANSITLRDFDKGDDDMRQLFLGEGYIEVDLPNTNIIERIRSHYPEDYLQTLSAKNRKHIRQEALRYEAQFEVEVKSCLTPEECSYYYQLFINVKRRNYAVNFFDYPEDIISKLSSCPGWEFLILLLKREYDKRTRRLPVAVCWCYHTQTAYYPMILGMDYDYAYKHHVYKQVIHQILKRAVSLGFEKVCLGLSADSDKKKFGAIQIPKVAYVQSMDPYHAEVIESMAAL